MRISDSEQKLLLKGFFECGFLPQNYELYLFGSRVHENKTGGDIDLLLIINDEYYDQIISKKHFLLTLIKKYIDDQRVDLTIFKSSQLAKDAFYNTIKSELKLIIKK